MPEDFVPLALILRPLPAEESPVVSPEADSVALAQITPGELFMEHTETLSAVRRFRAALDDALAFTVRRLTAEIAENVLARELALSAADVASIVAKARERFAGERVLAVRVHPCHGGALLHLEVEKIFDETLSPGDVAVELRSGTIDLRLRTRLETALDASVPA
jgi:flagellar biosynthesis/type III secretory pathway protein FliH